MPDEAQSDSPTFRGRFSKMVRRTSRSDMDHDREAWKGRGHLQRSQGCPARRKKGIECRQQAGAGIQNGPRLPSTTPTPGAGPYKNVKRQTSRGTADERLGRGQSTHRPPGSADPCSGNYARAPISIVASAIRRAASSYPVKPVLMTK
jgi:hypothetical protein